MKSKYKYIAVCLVLLALSACKKDALDQKTDVHLTVASTIDDYQQLMDGLTAGGGNGMPGLTSYASLGDYMSDDLYVTDNNYNSYFSFNPYILDVYKWNKNIFETFSTSNSLNEWNNSYRTVLNANFAIEGLDKITPVPSTQAAWNNAKGSAFFFRGMMFYDLAQFWAKPYVASSAANDIGIVLRLSSDATLASKRSSVEQSYQQMISDFTEAANLLPNTSAENTQVSKVRPSKAAAYAMLARVYLVMGDYNNALKYSNAALGLYSTLLDYSSLGISNFNNLPNFNSEILFYAADQGGSVGQNYGPWNVNQSFIDTYNDNDLRKQYFFENSSYAGGELFVGDYSGQGFQVFTGIAVDEIYLIRAESNARLGNTTVAMNDLNTLLATRWSANTFVPYTAVSAASALSQILTERHKEIIGRGLRWTDLRRLNLDPNFATTEKRSLLGQTYTLPPNDSRYTLQIPAYIVSASNGSITQTP